MAFDRGAASSLRVVVVDDHTFFRDGLVGLLRDCGLDVVGDVANGRAALEVVHELQPDVVVMDLSMPGMGGVETTRRMVEQVPGTKVLMLTVSQDENDVLDAILAGASGFVLKDGPIEDVVTGVERAAAGLPFFSDRIAPQLLRHVRRAQEGGSRANLLTAREMEILTRLADGEALEAVSEAMDLPEREVRSQVSGIIRKLQAESRGETAVRAIRDRIV
jgi:DNA-binding NarL/FixJ family response regulator